MQMTSLKRNTHISEKWSRIETKWNQKIWIMQKFDFQITIIK